MFPKILVPQNGCFIMENPSKMDDLGGPHLFLETPKWGFLHKSPSMAWHWCPLRPDQSDSGSDKGLVTTDQIVRASRKTHQTFEAETMLVCSVECVIGATLPQLYRSV